MRLVPLLASTLLWGAAAGQAVGQVGPGQPPSPLPTNATLRPQLADSSVLVGRLRDWQAQQLILDEIVRRSVSDARLVRRTIPLDSVSAAWSRAGSRWRTGAVAGAALGVGATLIAGAITLSAQDGSYCDAGCWTLAIGVGAAAGAAVGALVGYQFVVWRPIRF